MCDCSPDWPGILWPMATDGDGERDWVERCDDCQVYRDDYEAAEALSTLLGVNAFEVARIHDGEGHYQPFIERAST